MAIGIYIHIPYCLKKCPYCDFYSVSYNESSADEYLAALLKATEHFSDKTQEIDSIYFGGGTPNLFTSKRIGTVIEKIKASFNVLDDCEITLEANPESLTDKEIYAFKNVGVNRLSMGLQSANESELKALNRLHSKSDIQRCIKTAKECGILNISLDLMIGLENQSKESLKNSIDFADSLDIEHISAYMLKIEKGTFFYKNKDKMALPDDDLTAELYSFFAEELAKRGFVGYEISNFAKNSRYSRHNLKYWRCEEYIGIGAAAHGFYRGERYYYKRSIKDFIASPVSYEFDSFGGSEEEYIMLKLRLREGVSFKEFRDKFKKDISNKLLERAEYYKKLGFLEKDYEHISLNKEGFLVSNTIISDLLSYL